MKKLLLLLFTLSICACATTKGTIKKMNSAWIGQHFDQFVITNGAPSSSYQLYSGDIAYRWTSGVQKSGVSYIYGNVVLDDDIMVCEVQVITDSTGIIKQITSINDTEGVWNFSRCSETLKLPQN